MPLRQSTAAVHGAVHGLSGPSKLKDQLALHWSTRLMSDFFSAVRNEPRHCKTDVRPRGRAMPTSILVLRFAVTSWHTE